MVCVDLYFCEFYFVVYEQSQSSPGYDVTDVINNLIDRLNLLRPFVSLPHENKEVQSFGTSSQHGAGQ